MNWERDSSCSYSCSLTSPQLGRQNWSWLYEIKDTSTSLFTWEIHCSLSTLQSTDHRIFRRWVLPSPVSKRRKRRVGGTNMPEKEYPGPARRESRTTHHLVQSPAPCNFERVAYEVPSCSAKRDISNKKQGRQLDQIPWRVSLFSGEHVCESLPRGMISSSSVCNGGRVWGRNACMIIFGHGVFVDAREGIHPQLALRVTTTPTSTPPLLNAKPL